MFSFRRVALLLALGLPAAHFAFAQDSTPSSSSSSQQGQAQQPPASDQGTVSVQGRIKARREARRAAAIKDTYSHLYEVQLGMGYMRFTPGKDMQRTTFYAWNVDFTRYLQRPPRRDPRSRRGNYGTTFVGTQSLQPYQAVDQHVRL